MKPDIQQKLAAISLCVAISFSINIQSAEAKTGAKNVAAPAAVKQPDVAEQRLQLAIQEVEKMAQKEIDGGTIPGLAIAIVHKDKVLLAKGYGAREVGKSETVNADTVFQLASCSKPVGSGVVASIISDGKISWNSRISDLDPAFQMNDSWVTKQITIRDLYSHRSGLPEHSGDLLEDIGYDRAEVLHRLRYQEPDTSFRSTYAYTNFGMTEAAVAAAKSAGMSWEDASEARLYKPLGMNSTSSRFSDFWARSNKAVGHTKINGKWEHKYQREPDAQSPAGGVSSSVNDMAKWMLMQMDGGKYDGKQIIPKEPLTEAHHPQILTGFSPFTGLPGFYGLGFNVSYDQEGRLKLGHSGAFCMGAGTTFSMLLPDRIGICVLTNAAPTGVAEGIACTFEDLATKGKASRDWMAITKKFFENPANLGVEVGYDYSKAPAQAYPQESNATYVGRYSNVYFGELDISDKDGALAMSVGPKKKTFPLKHYNRDTFTFSTETENLTGVMGVRFSVGPDGKAASVLVEPLNVRGNGLFARAEK